MLTHREADALKFITFYIAESGGIAPAYDDIAAGMGIKSKSSITRLTVALEAKGYIRRIPGRARAIEVLRFADGEYPVPQFPKFSSVKVSSSAGVIFVVAEHIRWPGARGGGKHTFMFSIKNQWTFWTHPHPEQEIDMAHVPAAVVEAAQAELERLITLCPLGG